MEGFPEIHAFDPAGDETDQPHLVGAARNPGQRQEALQSGGKDQAMLVLVVVQTRDAAVIPGHQQALQIRIPQGKRPVSQQAIHALLSPALIGFQDQPPVATAIHLDGGKPQEPAQFRAVVQASCRRENQVRIRALHRSGPAGVEASFTGE